MAKTDERFDPSGYASVAERLALFWGQYPAGRVVSELHSRVEREGTVEITCRAAVYRSADDAEPAATGWASEREGDGDVNSVACLENTETSAIGRALANLGFAASRYRPSAEEMAKAARQGAARLLMVREGARPPAPARAPVDEALQRRADAVRDLLALLDTAEAAGFRARRAERLRRTLLDGAPSEELVARVEWGLREWLRQRGL